MSCPYYDFRCNDYYCMKKSDYIDSDTYYRYCRDYDYDDCPIHKDDGGSSGCFITSACVSALGCPDDGEELTMLRQFRDTYMMNTNDILRDEVKEYYKIAPKIVSEINKRSDFYSIYKAIYNDMIAPCIVAIKEKQFDAAYKIYKQQYQILKQTHLK